MVDPTDDSSLMIENATLYSEMNEYLEDVEKIERTAIEITELLTTFEHKLAEDSNKIESLAVSSNSTLEFAEGAKLELEATGDRGQSIFQKLTIWILILAALWILFLDFIN